MKIKWDPQVDAAYISFKRGSTQEKEKGTVLFFCDGLAIIKSDPTACCVDHTIHAIHAY